MIRLRLFGAARVTRADGADAGGLVAQPKRLALLAYLAVGAGTFHRRDSLLAIFWPELDQFAARRALRNTLYQLRLALGDDLVASRGDEEVMVDGAKVWCDTSALRDAVAAGRHEEAVALYRGELLDGFHVSNVGETFEEWLERERTRARDLVLRSLGALVDQAERDGRHADAARSAVRAGELAPLDEGWMRRAAIALDASGDRSGAIRLYEAFARRLEADLEVSPSVEARALFERLRTTTAAPMSAPVAPRDVATAVERLPIPPARARSWWPVVVAAAVIAFAAIAWFARPTESASRKQRVIVTVFENRTGDPRLDPVGDMVVDWLTRSIVQSRLVDVVDPRVLFTRGRTPEGRPVEPIALARRNGASTLVSGSYYRSGDSLLFIASVVDVASANVLRSVGPIATPVARATDGVEATRSRVLSSLASVLDPRFAAPWNVAVAPPPFEAYSPYIAGVGQFWFGDPIRAESLFALAASRDTTFDAALISLANSAGNLGNCAMADSIARLPRLSRHVMDPLDALSLKIALAHCHGRNEELLRLVIERSHLIPPSSSMQIGTASAELWANRPALSIKALRGMNPATDLDWMPNSDHTLYWGMLCEAYHDLGQYDSELVAARRPSAHPSVNQISSLIGALAGLRRSAEALQALDSSFVLPPELGGGLAPNTNGRPELTGTPAVIGTFAARELMVHGDTSASREAAASTLAWIDSRPTSERSSMEYRAYTVWLLEIQGSLAAAVPIARALVAGDTGNVDFRGTLGGLAAATGDTVTARREDAWLASLPPDRGSWGSSFYRARIAVLLGYPAAAAALVRESFERGAWPYYLHADPLIHRFTAVKVATR